MLEHGEPDIGELNRLAFSLLKERNWFISTMPYSEGWEWQKEANNFTSEDNEVFTDFTMLIQAMVARLTDTGS